MTDIITTGGMAALAVAVWQLTGNPWWGVFVAGLVMFLFGVMALLKS